MESASARDLFTDEIESGLRVVENSSAQSHVTLARTWLACSKGVCFDPAAEDFMADL